VYLGIDFCFYFAYNSPAMLVESAYEMKCRRELKIADCAGGAGLSGHRFYLPLG